MKSLKIGHYVINKKSNIFLIAECGVNHNGSLKNAFKLIDEAKKSGFNAVKFQTYKSSLLVHPKTNLANYQKRTNFQNQKKMLDKYALTYEDFFKLNNYCKKKKIVFLSTPFDNESASFLKKIGISAFKISSADLDNFHLLNYIKKLKKPIILSTGMASSDKIKNSIKFLNLKSNRLALLHCVSEYPTSISNSKLGYLPILKKNNFFIGISDHSDSDIVPYVASALDVKLIEKHITLSKKLHGPDHTSSLEVKSLKTFVDNIRNLEISLKNKKKNLTQQEKNNLKVVSRKLFFSKNLVKNKKIEFDDILPLRSNQNGINAKDYKKILNKSLNKNVKKLEIINWKKIKKK